MTHPNLPDVIPDLNVTIKNWNESAKPPRISNTTVNTYTIDPAGAVGNDGSRRVQIADYEPNRCRMVIEVIDAAVMLTKEKPVTSPDPSTVAVPGTGRYLPQGLLERVFFGPDAWWINAVSAATRVTVTKEYY